MNTSTRYTWVGFFVLTMVFLAVAIFIALTFGHRKEDKKGYTTYMREEVSGLSVQSPVRFNGVKVGYVSDIALNRKDPQQVKITMMLEPGTPVTTATIATLNAQGITGIVYVGLKALSQSAPPLLSEGSAYPVIPSQPSLFLRLSSAVQEVTRSVKALSTDIRKVFDHQNREALEHTLQNLNQVTAMLAANSHQMSGSLDDMHRLLNNSAQASQQFPLLVRQLQKTVASVDHLVSGLGQSGHQAASAIAKAADSVRAVSVNLTPHVGRVMQRLDQLTLTLQHAGDQLQQNPAVVIRGTTPARLGPGERNDE